MAFGQNLANQEGLSMRMSAFAILLSVVFAGNWPRLLGQETAERPAATLLKPDRSVELFGQNEDSAGYHVLSIAASSRYVYALGVRAGGGAAFVLKSDYPPGGQPSIQRTLPPGHFADITLANNGTLLLRQMERDSHSGTSRQLLIRLDPDTLDETHRSTPNEVTLYDVSAFDQDTYFGISQHRELIRIDPQGQNVVGLLGVSPQSPDDMVFLPWHFAWLNSRILLAVSAADGTMVRFDTVTSEISRIQIQPDIIAEPLGLCAQAAGGAIANRQCPAVRAVFGGRSDRLLVLLTNHRRSEGKPLIEIDGSGRVLARYRLELPSDQGSVRRFVPARVAHSDGRLFVTSPSGQMVVYTVPNLNP
ncbi:MAG: hypothetical protein IPM24_12230 [Bryobacterales bacterium]|nr:hypothetical protein [Bryobacterales bacterium]